MNVKLVLNSKIEWLSHLLFRSRIEAEITPFPTPGPPGLTPVPLRPGSGDSMMLPLGPMSPGWLLLFVRQHWALVSPCTSLGLGALRPRWKTGLSLPLRSRSIFHLPLSIGHLQRALEELCSGWRVSTSAVPTTPGPPPRLIPSRRCHAPAFLVPF